MALTVTTGFEWVGDEYQTAYAETNDPRVLAIIERDDTYGGEHIDGDVYAPAFYNDGYRLSTAGSTFMDDESQAIAERYFAARSYFVNRHYAKGGRQMDYDRVSKRYLRIFHDTAVAKVSSSIEQGLTVYIFDTPTFREHVGDDTIGVSSGDKLDWQAALDGQVFAIGFATLDARVTDETPVAEIFEQFHVSLECWGFLGEDYAKQAASDFEAGEPATTPMLEV